MRVLTSVPDGGGAVSRGHIFVIHSLLEPVCMLGSAQMYFPISDRPCELAEVLTCICAHTFGVKSTM